MNGRDSAAVERQMGSCPFGAELNFRLLAHAESASDFLTPAYYQRIARTLEDARFHLAFFDDRLALPDRYGDDFAESVRHGIRVVKLDLIPLLTAMGLATRHLGLGGTYSTTYAEPFHIARTFATLDHMLGGRAAWNIVTSLNDSEAANFGGETHPEHDTRYDRADEFVEVVLGHWDSWEDDAIVLDRERGLFADPAKVHRLDHRGKWFRSRGPFTVPRSPQSRPVLIQAGQSGRGRRFAARWGELLFVIFPALAFAQQAYREIKDEVTRVGRDPERVRVAPAIYCIVGETRAMAEDKAAYIEQLAHPLDALVLLSEVLNYDFARKELDEPFTDAELAGLGGLQALRDRVVRLSGKANPTTRDFVQHSGRGTLAEDAALRGHAHRRGGWAGGMVHGARVRRLRARCHPHAWGLRGLRAPGRARAAAARPVPPRVRGPHAAREPRPAPAHARRLGGLGSQARTIVDLHDDARRERVRLVLRRPLAPRVAPALRLGRARQGPTHRRRRSLT
jgi:FMN-dependent oxidoreductase (nitrilotriacetate monooxygenase family)